MADDAPWTFGRLLQWTTNYLKEHHSDSPRLDAEVLLAHVCQCQRIELYTRFEEPASDALRTQFRDLVKRRAQGTPVAYLVGYKEFYSLRFQVTPDVLIPRPETEFVLIGLFDCVKIHGTMQDALDVVDVGTGSGCLAVTAARQLPSARFMAIDIQSAALEVARRNAREHQVEERIEFIESDLFDRVATDRTFDYIISNPPYIATNEKPTLPRDVVDHEPHTALFAGEDGLDVLRRLIAQAVERLRPGGYLLSEIDPRQSQPLVALLASIGGFEAPKFIDDLDKRPRVLQVRKAP